MAARKAPGANRHPDIAAQLRAAAEQLGVTEGEIAARAGISRPAVRDAFAGGNLTLGTLRALASVLHIRRLKLDALEIEIDEGEVDPVLLKQTAEKIHAAGEFVDRLMADLERRDAAAKLVTDIGADARARLARRRDDDSPRRRR